MSPSNHRLRRLAGPLTALFLLLVSAVPVMGHAELETATPGDGATVPGSFEGPIVLTFSAALADGSKADLFDQSGGEIASAVVDGPGAKMTINVETPLGPDVYEIRWVSVGEDGDLERGTISFTVAAAPATAGPTPSPTPVPSASAATATPRPEPTPSASPEPSPTPPDAVDAQGSGDVLIPIVVGLLVVAVGATYLLSRRGRPTP